MARPKTKSSMSRVLEGDSTTGKIAVRGSRTQFVSPPDFLKSDPTACQVFMDTAEHVAQLGVLAAVDGYGLAVHATLMSKYIRHFEETGEPLIRPSLLAALRWYSMALGFDPLSRSKMLMDASADEDGKAEALRQRLSAASA